MIADLYPDAAVPKNAGRWISAVQYRMARAGHHRSASAVDRQRTLAISGTWPWAEAFLACWQRLCALPAPT